MGFGAVIKKVLSKKSPFQSVSFSECGEGGLQFSFQPFYPVPLGALRCTLLERKGLLDEGVRFEGEKTSQRA